MTEFREGRRVIAAPVTYEDIEALRAGDVFYYEGEAVTGRDAVHERVIDEGEELPLDISDKALLHAGPIVKKTEDGSYEACALGPTTSMRMEKHEYDFIRKTGVRILIGKGGMGEKTEAACREFGAVHCVMPAGNAVIGAVCTEEILGADWLDLGMPEACWHCRVKELGPLIVSIDISGHNLFKDKREECERRKDEEIAKLKSFKL